MGELSQKVQESRLKWYGHVLRREEEYVGKRALDGDRGAVETYERNTEAKVVGYRRRENYKGRPAKLVSRFARVCGLRV